MMSWNINSMTSNGEPKHHDPDTMGLLNAHDIVCLQEIRQDVPIPNFESFSSVRMTKKTGGVSILVKQSLSQGVSAVEVPNPDITAVKLSGTFFGLGKDVYIVNVYARPRNASGHHIKSGEETILECDELIASLHSESKEVILMGDFNARIGKDPVQAVEFEENYLPLPPDYVPDAVSTRTSQDITTNQQGGTFKTLILNNQMTILNGRTLGDFSGMYTSIQHNGCAVVDYIATTRGVLQKVDHMKVLALQHNSDHRPLSTQIQCEPFTAMPDEKIGDRFPSAPPRYIITPETKEAFKDTMENPDTIDSLGHIEEERKRATNPAVPYELLKTHLQNLCSLTFKSTNPGRAAKLSDSKPWHNRSTKSAKLLLVKATSLADRFPAADSLRKNFYRVKGGYRRLVRNAKARHDSKLNSDIEEGKVLNWQAFNNLKRGKTHNVTQSASEMEQFQNFFEDLYADSHPTLSDESKTEMLAEADLINEQTSSRIKAEDDPITDLNATLTLDEVRSTIKTLKSGKAAGEDQIPNEALKILDDRHLKTMVDVYNTCFDKGYYPWTNNIITPIHKKGSRTNPDNYRAVAVGSSIGKLFSTIMLQRLTAFRSTSFPDPPNQLGFCKGSQTTDHLFSLMTLVQKYRKLNKPLYAVFVDYRKAFDSIPRQALFLKLAKLGISGKFYTILRSMYSASVAQIKLSGHVSKRIAIRKGTEQGHPLSPELFKIFLFDLTAILNQVTCQEDTPHLRKLGISHLLFADDLIMLSLNRQTTQRQIDTLCSYCKSWGLEINLSKTKLLVFGKKNSACEEEPTPTFTLGADGLIEQTDTYCNLLEDLHLKAVRALYSLKRTIRKDKISIKASKALFSALIKPILLYGAAIWAPLGGGTKKLIKATTERQPKENLLRTLAADKAERLQLSYLKWCLGVNKYAPNAAVWNDTGSRPLSVEATGHAVSFLKRVKVLDTQRFVNAAYHEQKNLSLPWYTTLRPLLALDPLYNMNHFDAHALLSGRKGEQKPYRQQEPREQPREQPREEPRKVETRKVITKSKRGTHVPSREFGVPFVRQKLRDTYEAAWNSSLTNSRKLELYRSIDHQPGLPPYALLVSNYEHRSAMAKLRMSAHCLLIETGRHQNIPRESRHCPSCKLTMGEEIVETESHALDDCDLYNPERQKLLEDIRDGPDQELSHQTILPKHLPITHLTCDTASHSPRTAGLLARFVAAILAKRARWDSIANAINSVDCIARLAAVSNRVKPCQTVSHTHTHRNSKARHKSQLNKDIEEGQILNCQAFQKVKKLKTHSEQFNTVDMENFESFFKKLYSDTHKTLTVEEKNIMLQEADEINHHNTSNQDEAALALNTDISNQEISGCIRNLKCGKAAGDDMLSNDILKTLDDRHVDILTAILNKGFKTGIYPWTNSIITPLHKKGARGDPDNYRAVSVGSAIGKIFSTVMLDRLVQFRESKCPDPINQLGFRKGAQTSDHVLSLMTLAQKYRKTKTPLYATFVDYKKAFDSVPRQALFLKLP
eukprot:sb/3460854/